jgi:hypothetical protein
VRHLSPALWWGGFPVGTGVDVRPNVLQVVRPDRTSSSRRTKMSGQLMVASNIVWQMLGMPGHTIGS